MSMLGTYFLVALAVSVVVTPICRLAAQRLGCVAKPSADRWHRRPTALFGGVAIVVTVVGLALTIRPHGFIWQLVAAGGAHRGVRIRRRVMSLKAVDEADRPDRVASVLLFFGYRLKWTRVADRRLDADAVLDRRHDQRVQPARQHGRPLRRHRADRRRRSLLIDRCRRRRRVCRTRVYLATLLGATAGFLVYNVQPGVNLHGRHGQPVSRLQHRRR